MTKLVALEENHLLCLPGAQGPWEEGLKGGQPFTEAPLSRAAPCRGPRAGGCCVSSPAKADLAAVCVYALGDKEQAGTRLHQPTPSSWGWREVFPPGQMLRCLRELDPGTSQNGQTPGKHSICCPAPGIHDPAEGQIRAGLTVYPSRKRDCCSEPALLRAPSCQHGEDSIQCANWHLSWSRISAVIKIHGLSK